LAYKLFTFSYNAGDGAMNGTSLQKLIDEILGETGEIKRANKAKKTAAQSRAGASTRGSWNADKTDLQLGRRSTATPTPLRGDFGSKSKGAGDARKMAQGRGSFGSDFPLSQRKAYPGSLAGDMDTVRGVTQSKAQAAAGGHGASGSAAPAQVQAAVQSGGKVVFGRYYDARGQYLGRSLGGQWVDAKSDPSAQTQMEMYNKIMEIGSGKYKAGDREKVKKMIREIVKSYK
jgi:hypothetical protein